MRDEKHNIADGKKVVVEISQLMFTFNFKVRNEFITWLIEHYYICVKLTCLEINILVFFKILFT